MPWNEVMHKWKAGTLKSGSGGPVKDRQQAIAIMLSEKRKAGSKPEYRARYEAGTSNVGLAIYRAQLAKRKSKK
jgi:hypothetical protein